MKRWLPWLAIAGCARPPASEPAHELVVAAPVATPPAVVQPELPYARSTLPLAPHAIAAVVNGTIAQLAVPRDGGYVVTLDSNGGVLLWPSLDGKREPVVIATRIGAQVATLRDGDAIAIAVVDKIGQLELVRVTAGGVEVAHDDIAVPRPIVQLVATSDRLLALRDDQVVAALDAKGALVAEVEAPPGERIAQLVARGDHVVGISVARKGKHTARALLEAAWAPASKRFACDDDRLALSPDGNRLVGTVDKQKHVVEIDLSHGTSKQLDYDVREIEEGEFVLGVTDHHSVIFVDEGTVYERADKDGDTEQIGPELWSGAVFTPTRAIGGIGLGYLVIVERGKTKFLGYRSGSLADVVATSGGGWLATDGSGLFRLDAALRFAKTVETPFARQPAWQGAVAIIDEHHAVIAEDSSYFLYKLGADAGDLIASEAYGRIDFQRASGLAVLPDKTYPTLARWNAKQGKFDPAFELPAGTYSGFVRLFDPAATNGMVAMYATDNEASDIEGKQKIAFHEIFASGTKLRERERVRLVDNGDVFSGRSGPNLESLLPAPAVRATSADGTLTAELANARITLFDHDGNVRWARPANGALGVAWNGEDDLIAFGAGVAKVDLERGDFSEQRCGWDFGLWTVAPQTQTTAGMCVLP